jgi:hypothetical protein
MHSGKIEIDEWRVYQLKTLTPIKFDPIDKAANNLLKLDERNIFGKNQRRRLLITKPKWIGFTSMMDDDSLAKKTTTFD